MANRIEQLTDWLVNRADQQGLSTGQFKTITFGQVYQALPANSRDRLTRTVFLKAKRLALTALFKQKLDDLKSNTNVRQAILEVFPDAVFQVNAHQRRILIEVDA